MTKLIGPLAAALLLSACAVGPRYETPKTPPATFAVKSDSFAAAPFEAAWWTAFEDPILDDLERRALAGNLDLRVAVARVREARALFRDTRLDQLPRVTASGGYADGRTPQPGGPPITDSTWQAGFDAGWEIDLFGRVRRQVEAARADVGAAEADLRDAQVLVAAEVARNYFEYLGARDRLAVARRNLETQRDTLRLTKSRFDVGLGDAVGVASAQAALSATESSIPLFTIQATQAAHRLAVLVGERPGALDAQLAPERPRRVLARALPIGDASALLRRRPDVAAAERRLAAQTARVGVATADLFPRVTVTGFVGFLSGDLSSLGGDASRMWSVAPAVSWPALDFGGAQARLRVQQARSDAALATYEQTVLLALEDVQNALVAYAQTQSRVASLAQRSAASRRAAELARVRYREGATDFLTLLDAERTLLEAEDAESAAQTTLNTQVVALYKALGGGWEAPAATALARN
ncbi:MAG: RND transporter [Phenylobacterium sp. RIFCSPHIGHO2_01_FULL_69_31]|uniref:efflux transporter outer membrane subunit n=1 Tax=Phenylobacterium sp. RIFCSPHIGHO2_01_FULL_69_31 TaxID=1801944 RepID=UPI0008AE0E30|nr:TolC family protein [Phenylobacterium sp. RIFCSPHIGHO2_01_FULL_69_31]OHB31256.1 MAG: RND transporter [Phenylobacterium sp. RIFCSPHIGHO2_01_FULL_69_31]